MSSTPTGSQSGEWLDETEEYQLIRDLCNVCCRCLRGYQLQPARATSRRRNAVRTLHFQLRNALTRPRDLQLVIDLDWAQDDKDLDDAQQILRDLCDVLERLCVQPIPDPSGRSGRYINLSALLKRLEGSTNTRYDVISVSGHHPALFSCQPDCDLPGLVNTINVVERFNSFLDQLDQSTADMDPGELKGVSLTNATPLAEGIELSNIRTKSDCSGNYCQLTDGRPKGYFQHARTALRVLLSRLSICSQEKGKIHNLLLQLPTAEAIISRNSCTSNDSLQLFLSVCTESCQWQEAQVTFNPISDTSVFGSSLSICEDIKRAMLLEDGLLFHVKHALSNTVEEDLRISMYEYSEPRRRDLKPKVSLRELLDDDFLKPESVITSKRLQSLHNMETPAADADEKISLAVQILFGVVLCLRYESNMATWDPTRVFILAAEGVHNLKTPPYISVVQSAESPCHELSDLQASLEIYSCRTFTLIAKLLLEIGLGECLTIPHIGSEGNDKKLWEHLWRMVQIFKERGTAKRIDSLDMIPYFKAAELCLRFVLLYKTELTRSTGGVIAEKFRSLQIVEHIVSNQIIPELWQKACAAPQIMSMDSVMRTRSSDKESMDAGRRPRTNDLSPQISPRPSQSPRNVVKLFDGCSQTPQDSLLVESANSFFVRLGQFQSSFESFLSEIRGEINAPIRIAILDTGIDKKSVNLNFPGKHMKDEWCVNFVDGDDNVQDDDGHGTHCAALLQKAAPNADIYVAKVFSNGDFDLKQAENISKAIRYATDPKGWDVHIISMSFGLYLPSSTADMDTWRRIKDEIVCAIDSARHRLFFAAAANEGKNQPRAFPSTHPSVFCVHASDGSGYDCGINPHHNGTENNIMTLGTGIMLYDDKENDFVSKVGTSFATAIAAGMVASILDLTSRVPNLKDRSKEVLKTNRGMKLLFRLMSERHMTESRPYVAPWKYWEPGVWNVDSRGLDAIWAELDSQVFKSDCN